MGWHNAADGHFYARKFNADGSANGNEFRVDDTNSSSTRLSLTGLANGSLVFAWEGDEVLNFTNIHARVFAADGTAGAGFVADETSSPHVPHPSGGFQSPATYPEVVALADGSFVVAYIGVSWASGGESKIPFARVFNADGTARTGEFKIGDNPYGLPGTFKNPSVVALQDGGFLVAYHSENSYPGIYVAKHAADGTLLGYWPRISPGNESHHMFADVVPMPDGGWVVVWSRDGAFGPYGQRFDANGGAVGEMFLSGPNDGAGLRPGAWEAGNMISAASLGGGVALAWHFDDADDGNVEIWGTLGFPLAGAPFLTGYVVSPQAIGLSAATNAAVSTDIELVFNEAMQAGTGNIEIWRVGASSAEKTIAVGDATQVAFTGSTDGGTSVTINPATDLAAETDYYVVIAPGVLKDASGSSFPGLASATGLNFRTGVGSGDSAFAGGGDSGSSATSGDSSDSVGTSGGSSTAPSLLGASIEDNAAAVSVGQDIVLTFNEAVFAGSGDIEFVVGGSGTLGVLASGSSISIDADDASQISFSGGTLTISSATPFAPSTTYHLQFDAGAIVDADGNAFSQTSTIGFRTVAPSDSASNDKPSAAQALSSSGAAGALGVGDTTDYFSYTTTSAGLLSARLSGLSANLDVVVYDSAGKQRAKSQRDSTADESASTLVSSGETFLVRVMGAKGAISNYALDVDVDPLPAGEPDNNSEATAQTLDMSTSTFQASVGATWGDKTDFYKFVAPSSGVLTAGISGISGDLNLIFYDAAGKAIRPPKTTGTTPESVTALVVAGQTYGIQVQPTKGVVSDYTLTLPIAALPAGEPDNNALATAPTIDPATTINASVGASWGDKIDYYKFTAPITGVLSASLTGMSGDLTLNLLDASGGRLKKSANAGTADEAISHLLAGGETYVVQVQPSKGVVSDYTLNLPIAALPTGEPENNVLATAPTIASTSTTTGNVGAAWGDKVDYFKFTAASTGRLTAQLSGVSGDLDLLVINAAGKAVARSQTLGTVAESAAGLVTAGEDYAIRITPKKGVVSDYVLQTEIDSGVFL